MSPINVSIVVCTYNRAELLRDALASLVRLRTDGRFRYEVVVVDNASTDHTACVIGELSQVSSDEEARSHALRGNVPSATLRGVVEPRHGVSCARNRGIEEARGRWIAFFDDDQVADPDWLLRLLEMAERTGARCVGGAVRLLLPADVLDGLPAVCRELLGESVGMDVACRYTRRRAPGTGNLLVQRSVFDEIGRFDESLHEAGEDTDLYRRILRGGNRGMVHPGRRRSPRDACLPARRQVPALAVPAIRRRAGAPRSAAMGAMGVPAGRGGPARPGGRAVSPAVGMDEPPPPALQAPGSPVPTLAPEGYFRFVLHGAAPRVFPQQEFFASLDFARSDRP